MTSNVTTPETNNSVCGRMPRLPTVLIYGDTSPHILNTCWGTYHYIQTSMLTIGSRAQVDKL